MTFTFGDPKKCLNGTEEAAGAVKLLQADTEGVSSWGSFSLFPSPSGIPSQLRRKRGISISAVSAGEFISYKSAKICGINAGLTPVAQPSCCSQDSIVRRAGGAQGEEDLEKKTNKTAGKDEM